MNSRVLKKSVLFLLITTFFAAALQIQSDQPADGDEVKYLDGPAAHQRIKRAAAYKPGFFRTLFSVIYEQFQDTKNTYSKVNTLINDNFLPENAPKVETTTSSDPNATTTEAPFKITRTEFNRLARRNLKGLIRLYNIELQDALKQSDRNYADFKRNSSVEVSKFL